MKRKVNMLVAGRVQGVYFRAFTQKKANQLSIFGTVQNLPDGRVEITAEAESQAIEKFITWCHKGPITARVDHVDITELEPDDAFTSFTIR
jgi:acylphosphatase